MFFRETFLTLRTLWTRTCQYSVLVGEIWLPSPGRLNLRFLNVIYEAMQ